MLMLYSNCFTEMYFIAIVLMFFNDICIILLFVLVFFLAVFKYFRSVCVTLYVTFSCLQVVE